MEMLQADIKDRHENLRRQVEGLKNSDGDHPDSSIG
jgi:hypothetical protein